MYHTNHHMGHPGPMHCIWLETGTFISPTKTKTKYLLDLETMDLISICRYPSRGFGSVRIALISVSNYSGFQLTWNIQLGKDCTLKQTTPRPIEYLWYRVLLLSL